MIHSRRTAPILLIVMTLFGFGAWSWLPEQIESHWGISGEADGTMSRTFAVLLMPMLTTAIWALLVTIPRFDRTRKEAGAYGSSYRLIVNVVVLMMAAIHVVIILNGLGLELPVARVIVGIVGLELAIIGNEMRKLLPNRFAGIRTPWTLADDDVWRRTHEVGGRLFTIVGLAIAILSTFAPLLVLFVCLVGGIAALALGLILYSYLLSRKTRAPS